MPETTRVEPHPFPDGESALQTATSLAELYATLPVFKSPNPTAIDDTDDQISNHGLRIKTLIGSPAPESGPHGPYCISWVEVPPEGSTLSHVHWETWTSVIVAAVGPEGAITQAGQEMDEVVVQYQFEAVRIPPGKPHRARNPSKTHWLYAFEIRDCPSPFDDRVLLPDLDGIGFVMPSTSVVQHVTATAAVTDGRFG